MIKLTDKLNFSQTKDHESAVEIKKGSLSNHFTALCTYCADNDINLDDVDDADFFACLHLLKEHGEYDVSTDSYFFWID